MQVFFYLGLPLASNIILYVLYKQVNKKHLKGTADLNFRKAVFSQGAMIISFSLALTWIGIMPIEYHPFGYIFLGVGPFIINIYKKRFKTK